MQLSSGTIVIFTLVAYFLFSAAVGAMLPPTPEQHTRFYGWLYRFTQRLAANADRLAEARFGPALVPPHRALDQALADSTASGSDTVVTTTHVERIEASTHYEH